MSSWPTVRLGEVLRLDLDAVRVDASSTYPMVGVLCFGRGLFVREPVEGGNSSYRQFYRLKAEHVVMSQLFGWEGALALCSEQFAGMYVSPQFPTFVSDGGRLDRSFLGWFMKRPAFWADLGTRASGMGDRRRTLNPESLFASEIPLPPLFEQRRIVGRIEELAGEIATAQRLRAEVAEEAEALVLSLHVHLSGDRTRKLGDLLRLDEDVAPVTALESYPQVGVRSFGGGLFPKGPVTGSETTYRGFNRLYAGALVMSQVKGWEGALSICPDELTGWFVSPEYRTFRCVSTEVRPDYLAPLVRSEWFWGRLGSATRGVGARRERTRPEQFLEVEVPMPRVEDQDAGVRVFGEVAALHGVCAESGPELDAFMPAVLDRAFKGEL